jgi:hypothetical protein
MKFYLPLIMFLYLFMSGCTKDSDKPDADPSDKLALDSLVATKKHIVTWEEITVKAYTRGENLKFSWYTNHGSMVALDSATVLYWACPSCEGLNIIECKISNEFGSVSDTIMIQVDPKHGL